MLSSVPGKYKEVQIAQSQGLFILLCTLNTVLVSNKMTNVSILERSTKCYAATGMDSTLDKLFDYTIGFLISVNVSLNSKL